MTNWMESYKKRLIWQNVCLSDNYPKSYKFIDSRKQVFFRQKIKFLEKNDEIAAFVSCCIIKWIIGMIYERETGNIDLAYRHLIKKVPTC